MSDKPVRYAVRATNGDLIRVGDTLVWRERGEGRTGKVESAPEYEGGMRVGGRSLKALWEDADHLQVLR